MFSTLRAEMARHGIKTKDIAATLEVSRKTAGLKLRGEIDFRLKEMLKIRNKHFPHIILDDLFEWQEEEKVS